MTQNIDQLRQEYEHVQAILLELIDLPREQRASALENRCAGNEQLRAAVQSLLQAHGDDGVSRFQPTSAPLRSTMPTAILSTRQVGPYKILQEIGEGGFGTVY